MEQNSNGRPPGDGFNADRLRDVQNWRRSRSDRVLAGVCGGIARALNIDPVLIRVVMAVLILSGPGVLFYAAAWLLMPDDGNDRSAAQGMLGDRVRPDHPWLWPVVIGACVFLAIAMMSSFDVGRFAPGPLIVLGLIWYFVFHRKGECRRRTTQDHAGQGRVQDGAPQATRTALPQTGPAYPAGPASSATRRPQDRTVEPVPAVWTEDDPLGLYVDEVPARPTAAEPAPRARGRHGVKPAVMLLTGVAIAVAALADASVPMALAIGLATLGAGMVVGGFMGRTLALLPLGILLAAGVAVGTVFPSIPRDFADVHYTATPDVPITAANATYRFDAGSVVLDLTRATFSPGAKVIVAGGAGDVVVKLPPEVDVTAELSAQLGDLRALGQRREGHNPTVTVLDDRGTGDKPGPEKVVLDLELKLGSIEVVRG